MDLADALAFAADKTRGVLTTIKRDGRPQRSNIAYRLDGDTFDVSITATRAKYAILQRDPRASMYVTQDNFWAYAVFEGEAELTPVAADPNDATCDLLVEVYRAIAGEHSDWDEYRAAMVKDQRLVVRLKATRAYGMLSRA